MTVARVSLAAVLALSVVRTGAAQPCAPRADLDGDAEAVAKVAAELTRLGVDARVAGGEPARDDAPSRSGCATIAAAVELDRSGGIAVAVRDAAQRSEGRVVSDAAVAAAWIDAWLRDDFSLELDAPPLPSTSRTIAPGLAPRATAPGVTPPAAQVDAEPAALPLVERFALAASIVRAWSDDGTGWSGYAASACVRVGGACIGARFGYATQTVSADLTAASKRDLSLLATASHSYELGRMSIAPELGIGIGRLTTSRFDGCKDPMCDPNTDPTMCPVMPTPCESDPGTLYVGDGFSATTYTPRLSIALRVAIPLFDHVWLDGLAAAVAAPLGHSDEYATNPDGTTMNAGQLPLPGDPLLGVQLGVGLRVGAR